MSSPPSASLGSDGVEATLNENGYLALDDGSETVWLKPEEVKALAAFLREHVPA